LIFGVRENVGEEDEPKIIETLVSLKGKHVKPLGVTINSVASYFGSEYPAGVKSREIVKAPTYAKRDVLINGKGYSLKSTRAAPSAIVNHTTREKWIRVCDVVGAHINKLDKIVSEYWELRIQGRIGEDIAVSSYNCPFGATEKRRQYLKILINYFLFDGTGSKDSTYPADYLLEFADPAKPNTWSVFDRDSTFDHLWPKMIFSVRSKKGMPSNYPNIGHKRKTLIEPWVRFIDGDYRGALHIRAKK